MYRRSFRRGGLSEHTIDMATDSGKTNADVNIKMIHTIVNNSGAGQRLGLVNDLHKDAQKQLMLFVFLCQLLECTSNSTVGIEGLANNSV